MNEHTFDSLTRSAGSPDRRTSLKALGAAALGAALTRPLATEARKHRKRGGSKRKKRCRKEQKQCRRAVENFCRDANPADPQECQSLLLPCCRSCKVKTAVFCVLNIFED